VLPVQYACRPSLAVKAFKSLGVWGAKFGTDVPNVNNDVVMLRGFFWRPPLGRFLGRPPEALWLGNGDLCLIRDRFLVRNTGGLIRTSTF